MWIIAKFPNCANRVARTARTIAGAVGRHRADEVVVVIPVAPSWPWLLMPATCHSFTSRYSLIALASRYERLRPAFLWAAGKRIALGMEAGWRRRVGGS